MIGSRAWFALMRRNALYRRRHWLSTLLELALPIAFVGILVAIKNSLGDDTETETIKPTYPSTTDVYRPLSFLDYVTTLAAARICIPASKIEIDFLDVPPQPLKSLECQFKATIGKILSCDVTVIYARKRDRMHSLSVNIA